MLKNGNAALERVLELVGNRPDELRRVTGKCSGPVVTGFMMNTTAVLRPQQMGGEGDPALALRKSIDKRMRPNDFG